jgi:hypothetical protein
LLATEPTGAYLAVVNSIGLNPGESSVESFQINAAAGILVPVSGSFLELVSAPIGAAANPAMGKFYVYLGPNPLSSNPDYQQDDELIIYSIDPLTGLLANDSGLTRSSNRGRSFGADPLGRFAVTGQGVLVGTLQVSSPTGVLGFLNLGATVFANEIFVGPGQRFIYVTVVAGLHSEVHIYIVDTTTWSLTEAPSSPLPGFSSVGKFVADPTGQFVYQATIPNQVHVYSVDLSTGYFNEVSGSPFAAPGYDLPIAFSVTPGSGQPEVGPVATLTPANLVFGSSTVGNAAPTQSLTLSSTGDQALSVNAINVTGLNAGDFSQIDTCNPPTVLKPTTSCNIAVTFTPTASGSRLAQLSVTDNAPGTPQSVALTGVGLGAPPPAPAITFTPGTLNFSALSAGSTSLPLSVTLTNSGNAPLTISAISLGGSNPADFSAPSSNCTAAPIAPGASCIATESFTPLVVGFRQAALLFADNAAGSPQSISLIGTEVSPVSAPALKFIPTSVTFPATTQGLANTPITVAITNGGAAPMHISNISAGGTSAADFTNSVATCATTTVAANASCTVSVTFSPLFSGSRSETLIVTDDAPNSPQVLNIVASAPPAFSVSSPSAALSATVSAGQSATYALQLTPGLDYNGTISFICTGAPLGATCQAPPSVVLNTGVPATFTVTVLTSGNASLVPKITSHRSPNTPALPAVFFVAVSTLLFILLRFYRGRDGSTPAVSSHAIGSHAAQRKTIYAMVALLIFIPLIFAADGCGGAPITAPAAQKSSIVTPSGASTLVLTPTATNASGKALQMPPIQLTLIVN